MRSLICCLPVDMWCKIQHWQRQPISRLAECWIVFGLTARWWRSSKSYQHSANIAQIIICFRDFEQLGLFCWFIEWYFNSFPFLSVCLAHFNSIDLFELTFLFTHSNVTNLSNSFCWFICWYFPFAYYVRLLFSSLFFNLCSFFN